MQLRAAVQGPREVLSVTPRDYPRKVEFPYLPGPNARLSCSVPYGESIMPPRTKQEKEHALTPRT